MWERTRTKKIILAISGVDFQLICDSFVNERAAAVAGAKPRPSIFSNNCVISLGVSTLFYVIIVTIGNKKIA